MISPTHTLSMSHPSWDGKTSHLACAAVGSGTPADPYHCVTFWRPRNRHHWAMPQRESRPAHRVSRGMTRMGESLVAVGTAGPLASAAVRVWTFTFVLAGAAGLGYLLRIQSLQPLDVPFL